MLVSLYATHIPLIWIHLLVSFVEALAYSEFALKKRLALRSPLLLYQT